MKLPATYLPTLLFILLALKGYAQDFTAINYTVEDGLPSNESYSIIQDSEGYIWIGTDHGVARFDGKDFEVFTTSDGLPDNTIFEFYEDHKGRIWFFSFNGRVGFYHEDKFHLIPDLIPENETYLNAIKVTPDDSLFLFPQSVEHDYVSAKMNGDFIEMGSVKRVKGLSPEENKQFRALSFKAYKRSAMELMLKLRSERFKEMLGGHTKFTVGTHLNDSSFMIRNNSYGVSVVNWNMEISHWIECSDEHPVTGTSTAKEFVFVCRTNIIEKRSRSNPGELLEVIDFPNGIASSVFIDADGGYWVSTLNQGIFYSPNQSILTLKLESGKVDGDELTLALQTKKGILAASKKGLIYYYSKGEFEEIAGSVGHQIQNGGRLGNNWYFSSVSSAMICSDEGNLLDKISYNFEEELELGGFEYLVDHGDTFNINKSFIIYNSQLFKINGSSRLATMKKVEDVIWVGGKDGLFAFSIPDKKQLHPKLPKILKNRITDIEQYKDHLVLATRGAGVLLFDKQSRVYQIKMEDGLPANAISQVIVNNNRIWLSTNSGMCILNIESLRPFKYRIEKLNKEDGILSQGIDYIQYRDDTIYALSKGIFYSIPSDYKPQRVRPKIYVSKFEVNNQFVSFSNRIELNHTENDLSLFVKGIYFPDAENLSFHYSLNGGESWEVTDGSTILLPNLNSGKYTLLVKAVTPKGVSSRIIRTEIIIHPPFWYTWWFYLILIVSTVILMGVIARVVIRRSRLKSKLIELELRALRSQMNPHFTFNTLNSIQHYVLKKDPDEALEFIGKFSKLIRMVLENSSKTLVSIEEELGAVEKYVQIEQLRLEQKFEYEIIVDPNVDLEFDRIPSMIIQPYVENAIWHGLMNSDKQGKIYIRVEKNEEALVVSVEDNGVGRAHAKKLNAQRIKDHESVGMQITENRIELINSSLKVKKAALKVIDLIDANGNPGGTKVIVNILYKSEK